jgi:2-dehydropantoate 2-reductase
MRILIVGAGAVGALYGEMLKRAGGKISVLLRSGAEEIQKSGIHIQSIWGDGILQPDEIYLEGDIPQTQFDLILIATKVLPTIDPVITITNFIKKDTTILLIQNGLNIERPYISAFPENEILSALAFVCSNRHDATHIEHIDYGRLMIGQVQSGTNNRLQEIISMFESAGVPVEKSDEIERERWIKLIWNVPFNPLSVLANGVSTEDILQIPELRAIAYKLMKEIILIGRAAGFSLTDDLADMMMERTEKMRPYKTSMLLDFEGKRPMEIEAIVGEPLREAKRLGISAPFLEIIYNFLILVERANQGYFSHQS